MKTINFVFKPIRYVIGTVLLIGSMTLIQSCRSDGKKESRTEDALENTGDAMKQDAQDASAEAREEAQEAGDKIKAKTDKALADFRKERDKAIANMKEQKEKLDMRIDELQAKIKREGRKAKADARKELDELKKERDELGEDIRKAENATADAWKEIKKGFKRAGDRLDRGN